MKRILLDFFIYVCAAFSLIIPKKKSYFVFIPLHDTKKFSGNIRALVLYAIQHHLDIDVALITFNKSVFKKAKSEGVPSIYSYFGAFKAVLRAEHLIIDSGTHFFSLGNFSIVQLWHGTGFKHIGLLNNNTSKNNKIRIRKHYSKYKLIVASSEDDLKRKNKSFGTNKSVITGSPRNDIFFENEIYINGLRKVYNVMGYSKIITYAPTFRDFETCSPFSEEFWSKLNDYLKKSNTLFIVKKHPWDRYLKILNEYSNIRDFSKSISDVQELLLFTDYLITDYSSIATDYAITGRPILIYAYDYDLYRKKCRSIYYDLEDILPKPFIKNEDDLLDSIKSGFNINSLEAGGAYEGFKRKFHCYFDGNSSKRVMEEIFKI